METKLTNKRNLGAFDKLVKDTYNYAVEYLRKAHGTQTMEELHQTFSNLFLKGKLRESVRVFCEIEKGR